MDKVKYMIKRIFKMNYSKFFEIAKECSRKSGKMYVFILFDIIYCGLRHGAGYWDYYVFEMYNLTESQRKTYVTRRRNNELIAKYNNKQKFELIDNKAKFNNLFDKYLKRDWIYLKKVNKEKAIEWIKDHELFIAKNILGTCGKEIKRVITEKYKDYDELYDELMDGNYDLLEEYIIQHNDLMKLYPNSVNTIRLVTVLSKDKVNYIVAYLRIGNGNFVDNLNSGGMTAPIDIETGTIKYPATDKKGKVYEKHPVTGEQIVGFKIPYWKECLKMVSEAAHIVSEVAYCGWDISVTDEGPCFVEANPFPGHDIYQLPIHVPDKIGLMPKFEQINR